MKNSLLKETAAALFQRLAVMFVFFQFLGMSLTDMIGRRDGRNYMTLSKACVSGTLGSVPFGDNQYFLGYPCTVGVILKFIPDWAAVYAVQFLCLAGLIWAGRRVFENTWVMRWFVFCVPTFVLFSSLNMSEALLMFLVFAGLAAFLDRKIPLSAFFLGAALVVRPQAAFFLWVILLIEGWRKKTRGLFLLAAVPVLFVGGMFLVNHLAFGNALINFKIYTTTEALPFISFPGVAVFERMTDPSIALFRKIYCGLFILFTGAGLVLLALKYFKKKLSETGTIFLKWGVLQWLFYVSLGSKWGFFELPRYLIIVMPATLLGFERWLPKNKWAVTAGAVLCVLFCAFLEKAGNQ